MVDIFVESFETDGNGTRYNTSVAEFSDGSRDFFTRTDGTNISSSYEVTGTDGSFYFAAQDIDGEVADSQQMLSFSGIDISGFTNLSFSALFAEDDDGTSQDWDLDDFLTVEYQIDGGGFQNLLAIENDGSTFNSAPLIDTDFDGTGDGTEITDSFATFSNAIAATGSILDLKFTFNLNSGDEDIAIDDIRVTGENGGGGGGTSLAIAPDNAVQPEGNSGNTPFTFTVTRSGDTSGTTDVDYTVSSNEADATDFGGTLPTGTVNFAANETTKTISLNVSGDTDAEQDEDFTVTLSNPTNGATISTAAANGTIENDDASTIPTVIINEILADPASGNDGDANGDGTRDFAEDEFVEIVNNSGADLNISNWTLSDSFGVRHTFPANTVIPAEGAIVVFGGGTPTGDFGGAIAQTASSGNLGLNNGGDTVTLNDGSSDVAQVTYGGEGGNNQSLTRDPKITGNFAEHSTATNSGGALFSPGTQVDGTPFITSDIPFQESFESAPGTTYTLSNQFDDGSFDFFDRYPVPDNSNNARDDFPNGWDGSFGILGQDHDGDGNAATQTITIPDISIVGETDLAVTVALGALDGEPNFQNYETADGDGIQIFATIDEGTRTLIGEFAPPADGKGDLRLDTDGDQIGDGTILTTDLADFSFSLPNTGNSLDVEIELTSTGSFEPLAIDNVRVGGDETSDPPTPGIVTISNIQGNGDSSPLDGDTVTIEGIVTGDFQDGDADSSRNLGGFYVQEEDADTDDNAATSEGIFVFDGSFSPAVDVNPGDLVQVTGTVDEFFGLTEITNVSAISVVSSENSLPAPTPISLPTANTITNSDGELIPDLEQYEGMLTQFPDTLTVTEMFQLDRFGEIRVSQGGRLEQFTQNDAPSTSGFDDHLEDIASRTITIDDGQTIQNPDPIVYPDGSLDTSDDFRMGDTVTDLTGVIHFSRGSGGSGDETYRVMPTVAPTFVEGNLRPATPEDVGGSLKVASINVLNYFTTLSGSTAIGDSPRGADNATEFARQTDKLVEAITTIDADILGLVELENDFQPGSSGNAIERLVAELNAVAGANTYDWVDPGTQFVGDDAIAVGLIYQTGTVNLADGTSVEILDDSDFTDLGLDFGGTPVFNGNGTNRSPLAATFEETSTGETFTVTVNHFKSKGSIGPGSDDTAIGDGQGNNNGTRTRGAEALDVWLDSDPTGSGDPDTLVLGDLNAYAQEDPLTFLQGEGYTDLAQQFIGPDAYSFVFDGQKGTLDYALANESLLSQVTDVTEWHINADEPDAIDYNLDFGRNPNIFDGNVPYRASDHDPVILGLDLATPPIVSLNITDNSATEGSDTATFELTRDRSNGSLDIALNLSSFTTKSSDFSFSEGTRDTINPLQLNLSFADGEASKTVTVTAVDDSEDEADEDLKLTLASSSQYQVSATNRTGTINLLDNDVTPQTVSLFVRDETASEGGGTGNFEITRTDSSGVLDVTFNLAGSTDTSDYNFNPAGSRSGSTLSLSFADGQDTLSVDVTAVDDPSNETQENLSLTLANTPDYTVDQQNDRAVITLADNDQFTPIDGTPSADTLIGTTGNDLITGGNDSDILTGNGGNDRFVYNDFDDVGDVITDFGATAGGEQDLIDFSQLLNRLGLSNSNPIGDGLVTFTPFSGSTIVNLDRHGIGNPRPYLLLQGVSESNVDSSDFAFS